MTLASLSCSPPNATERTGQTSASLVSVIAVGSATDSSPALHGPGLHLAGGGTDVDPAMQQQIDLVRGCTSCATKVDVVIVRSTGTDAYNAPILAMNGVNSVTTLLLTSPADGNDSQVDAILRRAEVVFFAGGNQCDYVKWKGTLLQSAVKSVYARGGSIGGTSAGDAIAGAVVFDACTDANLQPSDALNDPYAKGVTFTYDMFDWSPLAQFEMEPHFVARDRMGRSMSFVARQIADGKWPVAASLAVEEGTSVVVGPDGIGTVMGAGPAYVVVGDHPCDVCRAGTPLTYADFKIWRLGPGATFDFSHRPTTGCYTRSVAAGAIAGDPYNGAPETGCTVSWPNAAGTDAGIPRDAGDVADSASATDAAGEPSAPASNGSSSDADAGGGSEPSGCATAPGASRRGDLGVLGGAVGLLAVVARRRRARFGRTLRSRFEISLDRAQ